MARLSTIDSLPLALLLVGLLACGGETVPGAAPTPEPVEPPMASAPGPPSSAEVDVESLLLVTIDTLRYDALGFNGNRAVSTPTLDGLAADGWAFDRAYAHNVVTLPSHVNILTGLLPWQHGVRDNSGFTLSDTVTTAATWLSDHDFATAAFVAAYPLDSSFGLARGFDVYDDSFPKGENRLDVVAERSGDAVVSEALEWWRTHSGRRRFLWVHLYDPHAPYEPPEAASDPYLGEVSAVDGYLAPLLAPIVEGDESVLVVMTADHGEALGDHGEQTHGLFAYEATLHVPLVLWAPGLDPGRRDELASHVDLLPTMLTAAGVAAPDGLAGRDLLAAEPGGPVYFESLTATLDRGWAPLRGVVDGNYKLIELPEPELYDLRSDRGETINLVTTERRVASRLARELPAESAWPPSRDSASLGDEAALRDLGYLGGSAKPKTTYTAADDPKNLVHLDRKMHQAIDRFHRGRLDEAERLTREILAERDDMGAAYYYLSQVLLAQERLPEAISVMARAREREAASSALVRQLGLSLSEAGDYSAALEVLGPLAESESPEALIAVAIVLSEAGDQAQAKAILERLAERDPGNPEAFENLALVALRQGDAREALRQARRAVELNDGLSLSWGFVGAASYQLGRKQDALAAWQRAVELDATNYDALFNITLVAAELGDLVATRSALERFVATAPPARYGPDIEASRRRLRELPQ